MALATGPVAAFPGVVFLRIAAGAVVSRAGRRLDLAPWPMGRDAEMTTCVMSPSVLGPAPEVISSNMNLWAGPALAAQTMSNLRRRLMLDGCKWDPQVGDV